jgi:hypothetical protein
MKPRTFRLALLLIAAVGLVLRLYVGSRTIVDSDEWQHLFIASSPRWADLSYELRTNAHPPLFFLLLKPFVRSGNALLYRFISIASGVGSIIVVGLIARRVIKSPVLQLLCAAAFALSTDAIAISVEVRSYQLMIFFVLVAFWALLNEAPAVLCVFATLAVLTHYSAVFFLGAAVVTMLRRKTLVALGIPVAVFAVEYFIHADKQSIQGYLYSFYPYGNPAEPHLAFLARNAHNFLNLFSPFELRNEAIALTVISLLVIAAIWSLWKRPNRAIVVAIVMVAELMLAGVANKYPFGGLLRHQYIAGPFLLIAAFAVVDTLFPWRNAIAAVLLLVSVAGLVVNGPKLILYPGLRLWKDEFNAWHSAFPNAKAVYLDHWAVIGYFVNTSEFPRTFVRTIPDKGAVIDEYSAGTAKIFYDKSRTNLDLADPSVYRSFASCLRESGMAEIDLFFFFAGPAPHITQEALVNLVKEHAAEQGLQTTKIVTSPTTVFASFALQ